MKLPVELVIVPAKALTKSDEVPVKAVLAELRTISPEVLELIVTNSERV